MDKIRARIRWAHIAIGRHGILAALRPSLRGRHAGVGRGIRRNPFGRAHGLLSDMSISAMDLIRDLRLERGEALV